MTNRGTIGGTSVLAALALAGQVAAGPVLDPKVQAIIDGLAGGPPIYTLSPAQAREVLVGAQSASVSAPAVEIEDRVLPVGPTGSTRVRILKPTDVQSNAPALIYYHGAGWVMGDTKTHDRLVRELAAGTNAVVIFVDYERSPEHRFPVAIEQDYAVLEYVATNPGQFGIDANRIAIGGDSVGGNMTAAVSLLAKQRGGPSLRAQLLFYPVTDASMSTPSYREFADGPWLTAPAMVWFWDAYLPDVSKRADILVSPINATKEQLHGLPDALVITAENDVLRDEGEAYARNLTAAGVETTVTRYGQTIHDFVLLNAISDTVATRAAMEQAISFLNAKLQP